MPHRSTLSDYYRDLLIQENQPFLELVSEWPSGLVNEVSNAIGLAYRASGLSGSTLQLEPNSTSQSAGNQVEQHFAPRLGSSLTTWALVKCAGAGYPDRTLRRGDQRLPVEFKSTGQWNNRDSNRCVLTSSSTKLRSVFAAPIHHLLLTAKFSRTADTVAFNNLRLDFLNPSTPVNVRFEGSVSQRLLAEARHPTAEF